MSSLRTLSLAVILVWAAPSFASAEETARKAGRLIHRSIPPAGARTHTVVMGERFKGGGFHNWFYGSDYRNLWNTPIEVDVLDLDTVGGGLTPLRTGGFGQSISLHFTGADGKRYTVRSVDKDPTRRLWDKLKETVVEDVLQDQISSQLPTGGVVVDPLMEATGILHTPHRRVVIPDDPRLGEFRDEFAGLIGTLQLHPSEGPDKTPGFAGSRDVKGSDVLWEDLEKSPKNRIDGRAFLKARLMDILINDKDRHSGQWRWARFPDGDGYKWKPIPEDRDQAFIDYDGFLMSLVRWAVPKQIKFEAEYPNLTGLTINGWELDREYLSELEKSVWDSMVTAFQKELPDEVIEDAVKLLPPPFYDQKGDFLTNALKTRRDNLPEFADRFYRLITKQAEVRATDKDEYVLFERTGGGLTLSIGLGGEDASSRKAPYFKRTYYASETKEIRLYAHGGNDYIEVSGGSGSIGILADGGGGDDTYVNTSRGGKTRFFDSRGDNRFDRGAKVNTRPYKRPPGLASTNTRRWLDWGGDAITLPVVTASPDLGAYGGVISGRQYYGYRRDPYSSKHLISLGVASDGVEPFIGYTGAYRHILSRIDGSLELSYSGIHVIRFNGLGNDTQIPESSSFYKVDQKEFVFSPGLVFRAGKPPGTSEELAQSSPDAAFVAAPTVRTTFTLAIGPILKYSDTPLSGNEDKYIGSLATLPYGADTFGQAGVRGEMSLDTRDNIAYPSKGILFRVSGAGYPEVWDVDSNFGNIKGEASAYLSAGRTATLALRAAGENVWGTFPFHEAAYVGGPSTLRGYRKDRFGGESSAYGNAELRLRLSNIKVLFPGEFGVFGGVDAGRVWFDPDPSSADDWHTGVGGGIWISLLDRTSTLSLGVFNGDDLTGLYVTGGFMF